MTDPASMAMIASTALQGANLAHHLGQKYLPAGRKVANKLFGKSSRQTASKYLKGLTTLHGVKKLVTKDVPRAVKSVAKSITSGKAIKKIENIGGDIKSVAGLMDQSGLGGKHTEAIRDAVDSGIGTARGYHNQANQYIEDFHHNLSNARRTIS